MPLAFLRIEFSKPDGSSDVVEVRITDEQISNISDELATAKRKLHLIVTMLAAHRVPVPILKSSTGERE